MRSRWGPGVRAPDEARCSPGTRQGHEACAGGDRSRGGRPPVAADARWTAAVTARSRPGSRRTPPPRPGAARSRPHRSPTAPRPHGCRFRRRTPSAGLPRPAAGRRSRPRGRPPPDWRRTVCHRQTVTAHSSLPPRRTLVAVPRALRPAEVGDAPVAAGDQVVDGLRGAVRAVDVHPRAQLELTPPWPAEAHERRAVLREPRRARVTDPEVGEHEPVDGTRADQLVVRGEFLVRLPRGEQQHVVTRNQRRVPECVEESVQQVAKAGRSVDPKSDEPARSLTQVPRGPVAAVFQCGDRARYALRRRRRYPRRRVEPVRDGLARNARQGGNVGDRDVAALITASRFVACADDECLPFDRHSGSALVKIPSSRTSGRQQHHG